MDMISIHALLAESDGRVLLGPHRQDISIHALLAESDCIKTGQIDADRLFQSTLSLRRATIGHCGAGVYPGISIHALLAESDAQNGTAEKAVKDFNPRSPCGERLYTFCQGVDRNDFNPRSPCGERPIPTNSGSLPFLFQSTLSLRRATRAGPRGNSVGAISIHALLAESDMSSCLPISAISIFQSTLSLRRATWVGNHRSYTWRFQSTLSLRRAT